MKQVVFVRNKPYLWHPSDRWQHVTLEDGDRVLFERKRGEGDAKTGDGVVEGIIRGTTYFALGNHHDYLPRVLGVKMNLGGH